MRQRDARKRLGFSEEGDEWGRKERRGDCLFPISDPFSFSYVNPTNPFLIIS